MITTEDIRGWATALPEVEETSHFRFRGPLFKVRGTVFAGMGKDETAAVFCLSEQAARSAAAADPATCEALRRMDARWTFLGLEVQVSDVSEARIRGLVEGAWRHQAPKRLVAEYDQGTPASARLTHESSRAPESVPAADRLAAYEPGPARLESMA
ncbi:MAG TPA: MmcQ/YjbR family DNA-binding protein [Candidatus Micrarchaeia archaeon]|nr:MmcQ/YjbR family DNA-binding protein [Candidatus Micrarchaeia archaeon]